MFSHNADKMSNDMKRSPSCDGFYILLNDSNRDDFEKRINEDYLVDYNQSLDFYNRGIERNKTLPDAPELAIDNMFDEVNSNDYKSEYTKPSEPEEIRLRNLEGFK